VHEYLGLERAHGLSELIAGQIKMEDAIHAGVLPNLDVITTGLIPPNPAELLMSESCRRLLDRFSSDYDLVIIDTPPILVAADTAGLAAQASTILFVARADTTQMGEILESAKRLAHGGGAITGVIFNAMDMSRRHYGAYNYKYGGYRHQQYRYGER
jgi:tyrosine-protein kinase Etk/Wzc